MSDKVNVYVKRINCFKEKYVVKLVFTKLTNVLARCGLFGIGDTESGS